MSEETKWELRARKAEQELAEAHEHYPAVIRGQTRLIEEGQQQITTLSKVLGWPERRGMFCMYCGKVSSAIYCSDCMERMLQMPILSAHEFNAKDALEAIGETKEVQITYLARGIATDSACTRTLTCICATESELECPAHPSTAECPCSNSGYPVDGMCAECVDHISESPEGPRPDDSHYGAGKHCSWCTTLGCKEGRIPAKPVEGEMT